MLRIFAPQVPLYGVGIVLAGVLQAHRRFLAAALAPLLSSLVVIGAYLVYGALAPGPGTTCAALPAGAVLGAGRWAPRSGSWRSACRCSCPVLRAGVRLRPDLRFPDGLARRAGSLAAAGVLALVAQQAAVVVTVWLAAPPRRDRHAERLPVHPGRLPAAVRRAGGAGRDVRVPRTGHRGGGARATASTPATAAPSSTPAEASPTARDRRPGTRSPSRPGTRSSGPAARWPGRPGPWRSPGLGAAVLVAAAVPVGAFFRPLDAGAAPRWGRALAAMPAGLVGVSRPGWSASAWSRCSPGPSTSAAGRRMPVAAVAAGWLVAASGAAGGAGQRGGQPRHARRARRRQQPGDDPRRRRPARLGAVGLGRRPRSRACAARWPSPCWPRCWPAEPVCCSPSGCRELPRRVGARRRAATAAARRRPLRGGWCSPADRDTRPACCVDQAERGDAA